MPNPPIETKKFPARNLAGPIALVALLLSAIIPASAQDGRAKSILDLTNQARKDANLKPLVWDESLAKAAQSHAEKMAAAGTLSHQYAGEPDVAQRAAAVGAHFSLIEENIAMADTAFHVHQGWMKSPPHHDNLLNADINRIGVGVVEAHGELYAVADYAKAVDQMTTAQVEAAVAKVVAAKGVTILPAADQARAYCAQKSESGQGDSAEMKPSFLMRWSGADITNLPPQLSAALSSGEFKQASVGSCEAAPGTTVFSGYKVAVLLY